MQSHTPQIALQQEDITTYTTINPAHKSSLVDESSIAHFCAFVDFYTRHCDDPLSTSLACEKQAEGVEIRQHDVNAETIQMLLNTMLEVIDHLEKKWLDEQIQLEDRQQRHRDDVARLYQQLAAFQQAAERRKPLYRKGIAWIQEHFMRSKPSTPKTVRSKTSQTPHMIRKEPVASETGTLVKLAA